MRVNLPGGATAELRDKPTVAGRDLLREEGVEVFSMISERWPDAENLEEVPLQELGRDGMRAFHRFNRAGVVALLKSWSRPEPVPTMDTVGDMDPDDYDALAAAVAPLVLQAMLGKQFDPASAADPDSPTVPSSVSDAGGQAPRTRTIPPPPGLSTSTTSTSSVA